MKKKFTLMTLFLFSRSLSCMQQQEHNNDVVIDFGEDEKALDADTLINLSANEVDLESGLQFQDFYNEKEKRVKGLLFYLTNRLGLKRTRARGDHNDFMANYVCTIASNLEKLSEHIAQDSKDAKELAEKNVKLVKKKNRQDFYISLLAGGISIASLAVSLHYGM